jgi:hypothetical protein
METHGCDGVNSACPHCVKKWLGGWDGKTQDHDHDGYTELNITKNHDFKFIDANTGEVF